MTSCISIIIILRISSSLQCFVIVVSQVTQSMSFCNNILVLLQSKLDGWAISLQVLIASDCGDSIYAVQFVFSGYLKHYTSFIIHPTPMLPLHNPSFCIAEYFNSPSYSRFTTRSLTSFPSTSSDTTSLHRLFIHCFASPHTTPCLSSDLAIIDPSHSPPEPPYLPSSPLFDW